MQSRKVEIKCIQLETEEKLLKEEIAEKQKRIQEIQKEYDNLHKAVAIEILDYV